MFAQRAWAPHVNEEVKSASPEGLEGVPGAVGLPASIERPEPIWWPKKPEDLPGRDLRKADLKDCPWLLPEHLAGSDLTGNRTLPDEIAKFPALNQVKDISSEARKIFIGLLAACVYSWLVIGTTTDVALILNTASSPLPIINTPIPIADFYWVGPTILAAVYWYLHFYLLRLWRTLATLPAIFPDGTALDDKTDPWLLTGLARNYMPRIPARPLGYVEIGISVLLAWLLVPCTLFFCWWRLLPAHHINRLIWLALLIAFTLFIGWRTFHLARTTLQRQVAKSDRARVLLGGIWRDFRASNGEIAVFCLVSGVIGVASMFACWQAPRDADTNVVVFSPYAPWQSLRNVDPTPAKLLNFVGIRTYADLRDVNVAEPPDGWNGKDWSKVKRVDLRGRNLAFADAARAFLANADVSGVNLRGVILLDAQLHGAQLGASQLQGADLTGAQLQGADLTEAQLQGASLAFAQLEGADLTAAQLQGAQLWAAQLQGAELSRAQLQGAQVSGTQLQGANLAGAQLQGANFAGAQLQGAQLSGAQLQGADLRKTGLWRADMFEAKWDYADLRGAGVQEMSDSDVDALLTEAMKGIPDEGWRKQTEEWLRVALRTEGPARHYFPEIWRSEPNVMFDRNDPTPEPFDWGRPNWATEEAYDKDLGIFLGDLACGWDAPDARTRGLTGRALGPDLSEVDRIWPEFFAARLIGSNCPPARALPDHIRRHLEQLAARGEAAGPPNTPPPDGIE